MALAEKCHDIRDGFYLTARIGQLDRNKLDVIDTQDLLLKRLDRNVCKSIQIDKTRCSARHKYSDDAIFLSLERNEFPYCLALPEKSLFGFRTQNYDPRQIGVFFRGKEAAARDLGIFVYSHHICSGAEQHNALSDRTIGRPLLTDGASIHGLYIRYFAYGETIFDSERCDLRPHRTRSGIFARHRASTGDFHFYLDQIGAETFYLAQDESFHAFAERSHHHHREDADHYAQESQKRTHLVRPDGLYRERERDKQFFHLAIHNAGLPSD